MTHIYELAAYNHDRLSAEYQGHFRETMYVWNKLIEYGLEDAAVHKYPGGTSWDGHSRRAVEVSPGNHG